MIEKRDRRPRSGRAYVVYRVRWHDADGVERNKTFRTERDAIAFEAKVVLAKRTGDLGQLDAGKETLADFAERWWELYAGPNLSRSTLTSYANHWNLHALPRLGGYRLRELDAEAIAHFRAELEAVGVGPATVRRTLAVVQSMLQRAVEWRRISQNPVRAVRKPTVKRMRSVQPLAPDQVEALRGAVSPPDATLISVLAYAGLRPEEALALGWGHIRDRTILVEAAASFGELKPQKTERPPRVVPLLAPLKQDLAEFALLSRRPRPQALIFPSHDGELWRDHTYRNWRKRTFQVAAADVGLGTITATKSADGRRQRSYKGIVPYDLRHTYASLRLWEHASVPELADELGHSASMTLDTYGHVIRELHDAERRDAAEEIRKARARRAA